LNSHSDSLEIIPTAAEDNGRERLADLLSKAVFAALLGLLVVAAIAYGGSDPLWKALLSCAIFAVGFFAALEMVLSNPTVLSNKTEFPGYRTLLPVLALALFALLQTISFFPLNQTAFGIGHPFWNAISADPYETRIFALELSALIVLTALFFRYATSDRRLRQLVNTIIAIAVVSALFGLLRQTMQHEPGFLLPLLKPDQGYGQFINKNHFAYVMEIGLGLTLGLLAGRGVLRQRAPVYLAVLLPIWTGLVLSNSRGGILAMLVQLVVTVLLFPLVTRDVDSDSSGMRKLVRSPALRLLLLAGLIALVICGLLWVGGDRLVSNIQATRGEFGESTDSREGATRVRIWQATLQMIRAHPIAGVGMGGYWTAVPSYHEASGSMTPQQAHNDYLELVASGGIIGLAIFLWFLFELLKQAQLKLRSRDRFRRAECFAALIAMTGVAVHSLVDFGLHRMLNAMLFASLIVIATAKSPASPTSNNKMRKLRSIYPLIALLLLVSITSQATRALPFQDIASGASAFQGQDIMGGAAVIFKRPQRIRDLVGGGSMAIVKKSRPPQIARNTPPVRRPTPNRPAVPVVNEPQVAALSEADKAEAFKDQGNNFYALGQHDKAVDAYKNALQHAPKDPDTHNNLGATYLSLGRNAEAAAAFKQAIDLKPGDPEAHFNLGVALSAQEKFAEAVDAFTQATRFKPDWADAYNVLGDTYSALARYEEAAQAYRDTVRLQPDNAGAYSNLGFVYDKLGRASDSIQALQKSVLLKPDDVIAHNNLGASLYKAGRYKEAVTAFQEALKLKPGDAEIQNNLGEAQSVSEQYPDAIETFKRALVAKPDLADIHYNLGNAYFLSGKTNDALASYRNAIRLKPDYADAFTNIGTALTGLGNYEGAISKFQQAVSKKPDNPVTYNDLGYAYYKLNKLPESIAAYQEAVRLKPNYAKALNGLGDDYNQQQRYAEAVQALKQAIAARPDYTNAHYNLGKAYVGLQNYNAAIDEFKIALQEKPDFASAAMNLTAGYYLAGRFNEAIEAATKAVTLLPRDADAQSNLGTAYFRAGKFNEAVGAFKTAAELNPRDASAQNNLGQAYFKLARYQEAANAFKEAVGLQPRHAQAHYNLGLAYVTLKNVKGVQDELAVLQKLDPKLAEQLLRFVKK
jgi:tetratricopeptide (TPR) repeat protein/O-antigen ligase